VVNLRLVAQLYFTLGGVDVEIDQGGINIDEEIAVGKRPSCKQLTIAVGDRLHQGVLFDRPIVHIDFDV